MPCAKLSELPLPPEGKNGWPWTEETNPNISIKNSQDNPPRISIIVPSYNQGEFIELSLRSILLQGYPNLELIVIDGDSKDETVSVLRKYNKWIDYWVSEPDKGLTNACNKGFIKASGELCGIMCADDYYLKNGIINLYNLYKKFPESILWAGACFVIDNDKSEYLCTNLPFLNQNEIDQIGIWGKDTWFSTVACIFKTELYKIVNGFDERFTSSIDVDLWNKLIKLGHFSLTDQPISTARFNPESVSNKDTAREYTALIASNYLNGDIDIAKKILIFYSEQYMKQRLNEISVEEFVALKNSKSIFTANLKAIFKNIKLRLKNRLPF